MARSKTGSKPKIKGKQFSKNKGAPGRGTPRVGHVDDAGGYSHAKPPVTTQG